jgi:hypothetical protein
MGKKLRDSSFFSDYLGCYSNFAPDDLICRKFCAISVRCAIDKDNKTRFELIQDMAFSDDTYLTIQ